MYKVKSNHLLDCLGPWKVDRLTTGEVTAYLSELHQCLENIRVMNVECLLYRFVNKTGPYFHCFPIYRFSTNRFSIIFQDDEHIVQCCTEATPPTFNSTHELLNYARSRVRRLLRLIHTGNNDRVN